MSRQKTRDEVRAEFMQSVAMMIDYWACRVSEDYDARSRLEGLAHSFLTMLDGEHAGLPGFVVAPAPHPDDRAFHEAEGDDYYPEAPEVECDIGGALHEDLYTTIDRWGFPRGGRSDPPGEGKRPRA